MTERLLARLAKAEARVEWLYRKLQDLSQWQRWAEQRIREIGQAPAVGYAQAPNAFDPNSVLAVGTVTVQIAKATGPTTAGSGSVRFYTSYAAGALGNLGDTVTCYSINQDNAIKVGATVFMEKRLGLWWVSTTGKCTDLV